MSLPTLPSLPNLPSFPKAAPMSREEELEALVRTMERRMERERMAREEAERIAEEALRRTYQRQQELEIMERMALQANASETVEAAFDRLLPLLCEATAADVACGYCAPFNNHPPSIAWAGIQQGYRMLASHTRPETVRTLHGLLDGRPLWQGRWLDLVTQAIPYPPFRHGTLVGLRSGDRLIGHVVLYHSFDDTEGQARRLLRQAQHIFEAVALREENHRSLERSRERYQRVVQHANDAIYLLDDSTGRFIEANDAYLRLTGYSWEQLQTMTIQEITGDPEDELRRMAERITQAQDLHLGMRKHQRVDGDWVTLDVSAAQVPYSGTSLICCVARDATARLHHEAQLIRARETAEAATRLRDTILQNLNHEFRTPLAVILGSAQVLEEEVSDEARELTQHIVHNGERLRGTLTGIVEFAELQSEVDQVPVEVVDLAQVLRETATPYRRRAQARNLSFHLDVPGRVYLPLPPLLAERMFVHLLNNAIKFTEHGGIEVRLDARPDAVYVQIQDTGIGIHPDKLDDIFEAFVQESDALDRGYEGNGLGLTIARLIARRLGAQLSVTSTVGSGSCFTVRFAS